MIGVTGYMSGGKSYFAVEQMLRQMYAGHRVVSNIQLKCREVTTFLEIPCIFWKQLYYYLDDVPKGYHHICISDYMSYPRGSPRGSATYDRDMVFVYLDEASSIFDSMVHASDGGIQAVAAWARQTEKQGIRVYLIMQFASELHKRLRTHITEYIECTNPSTVKIKFLGKGLPRFFKNFTIRTRYLNDAETKIGHWQWVRLDPRVYNCYRTSQIVVGSYEIPSYQRVNIDYSYSVYRQSRRVLIAVCVFHFLFLVVLCFLWWGVLL